MATKYCLAAGGNWNTDATWSTTSSVGLANTTKPTAADDVIVDVGSATLAPLVIDAASVCRSLNCTGFINTITHNAFTLTIGDATAGTGNIALKLVAGMTYTLADVVTSAITFASTSATQQTVDFGGKAIGNLTFGTSGTPNYAVISALSMSSTANLTSTFGDLHLDGSSNALGLTHNIARFIATATNVRTVDLGTAIINYTGLAWNIATSNNLTFNASTAVITQSGTAAGTTNTFTSGNRTYGTLNLSSAGESQIVTSTSGVATFTNLTRTGTPGSAGNNILSLGISAAGVIKVTGTLTVTGTSTSLRANVWPTSNGRPGTLDISGATLVLQYCDFQDIIFKTSGTNVDLSGITGGSGDEGGNSIVGGGSLTFTSPITQHWLTTGAGNWSDLTKWTSRVPLPQDSIIFDTAFTGSPTITMDMSFACGSVDASGSTGSFTINGSLTTTNMIGTFKGRSGLTISGNIYFNSRVGTDTFTFGGMSITAGTQISSSNGGTFTFLDSGNFAGVQHRSGTLIVPSGITVGMSTYISNATNSDAACLISVNGILKLSSTGTLFSMTNAANLTTINGAGSISITNTSASTKTFAGGGNIYPIIAITGGGSGAIIFTGANTFKNITVIGGTKTLTFPASITTTLINFTGFGNTTNVITINSSSGGTPATLTKASGADIQADYLSISDSTVTGGVYWFAGANSTNTSGNTGWIFQAAIPGRGGSSSSGGAFGLGAFGNRHF